MKIDAASWIKKRVIMLSGEESALRARALEAIIAASEVDEFDREEILADQQLPVEWIGSVGTTPFLSDRRVTVVRHIMRAAEVENVAAMLAGLPESALLILVADEEVKGDLDKAGRQNTTHSNWEKLVKGAGGEVIKCTLTDAKAAFGMIRADAKALGKEMTTVAAEALLELCGGNYTRAYAELEKLALFVGSASEIRERDVQEVAIPSREWNIFKLVDSVVGGQPGGALRQLKILISSPAKAEEAASRSIIPMMLRQVKLIWQARMMQDSRMQLERCQPLWPGKPNLATEKDWTRRKATDAARKIQVRDLELLLKELADADARLKGILPGGSPIETLELCIMRCCDIVRPLAKSG